MRTMQDIYDDKMIIVEIWAGYFSIIPISTLLKFHIFRPIPIE